MALGTTNLKLSDIASEVGQASTDISLKNCAQDIMILNPGNNRQTFTVTDSLTLNVEDSSIADNMNLAGNDNFEVSEFKSLSISGLQFSNTSTSQNPSASNAETINNFHSLEGGGCFVPAKLTGEIYCSRVGNDLVWFIHEPGSSIGAHKKEGTSGTFTTPAEVARIAGIASNTATTVSIQTTQLENTQSSGMIGQTTVSSSGSTSANLISTNTKVGHSFNYQGLGECIPNGSTVRQRFQLVFSVNHPDFTVRTFKFFVGLRGNYSTDVDECC